jgi:hypothetical protein
MIFPTSGRSTAGSAWIEFWPHNGSPVCAAVPTTHAAVDGVPLNVQHLL